MKLAAAVLVLLIYVITASAWVVHSLDLGPVAGRDGSLFCGGHATQHTCD